MTKKNKRNILIIASILLSVLFLSFLGNSFSPFDLFNDKSSDDHIDGDVLDSGSPDSESADGGVIPDDGESEEQKTPHILTLSGGDIDMTYLKNESKGIAFAGFQTDDLKANTKYMVSWTIDPDFYTDTRAYINQISVDDGLEYVIYTNTDWGNTVGLGTQWGNKSLEKTLDNSVVITSGNSGSVCLVSLFCFEHLSLDSTIDLAQTLLENYVVKFTFTEIL